MALDQINQYPVTASTIDANSYFDIDQWDGVSAWESQKVPPSVMATYMNSLWTRIYQYAVTDEVFPLIVKTGAITFRSPGIELTDIRASTTIAGTGAKVTVDVKLGGVSIFSTLLTIDDGSKTSVGATIPAVLSTTTLTNNGEVTIDITVVGSTVAGTGLKVDFIGTQI